MVEYSYGILNLNQDSNDGQGIRLIGRHRRANVRVGGLVVNEVQLCVVAENQGTYCTLHLYSVMEASSTQRNSKDT